MSNYIAASTTSRTFVIYFLLVKLYLPCIRIINCSDSTALTFSYQQLYDNYDTSYIYYRTHYTKYYTVTETTKDSFKLTKTPVSSAFAPHRINDITIGVAIIFSGGCALFFAQKLMTFI